MENPCKIIFFGDSITKEYTPIFEKKLRDEYPEIELTVMNAGVVGETSRDGITRLNQLVDEKPDIAVIGFGMEDWRKGIGREEYKRNLIKMLDSFESVGTRVIINTIIPSYNFNQYKYNSEVDNYSEVVREIAYKKRIKIADINAIWKRELHKPQRALRDDIHPNGIGYEIICKSLMYIVPRRNTTVLWQYNGHEAKCNYRCPYCYYVGLHRPKDRFTGYIEQWHERFKEAFGNQHLIFYLAFGEPTYGTNFPEILEMVDSEPNWEIRMTSNVSYNQETIVKSKSAQQGRLNINASYHPCMIDQDKFLRRILFLREHGIEVPIVYVAYPKYLPHFEEDIRFFSKYGFVVHVRRFIGEYKGRWFPKAYSKEDVNLISRYSDSGTIRYMLNQKINRGWLTYSGLHFFVIDNAGNIGYDVDAFAPYTKYRCIFGNIHTGNFKPTLLPTPFPSKWEGTVDGIANLVDLGYKELENNNVLCFARQGGVYKGDDGKVVYSNKDKDFTDKHVRAEFLFPPRKLKDILAYKSVWKRQMFNKLLGNKKHVRNLGEMVIPRKYREYIKARLIK